MNNSKGWCYWPHLVAFIVGVLSMSANAGFVNDTIEKIANSEFIFDTADTNSPFLPIAFVDYTHYGERELSSVCLQGPTCDVDWQKLSQMAAVPIWINNRDILLVGEYLSVDWIEGEAVDDAIYSFGAILAWLRQVNDHWQVGTFVFPTFYSALSDTGRYAESIYLGSVGRHRHSARFHSYWGLAADINNIENIYYPYLAFDWFINREWAIAFIMPWPAITYAPNPDYFWRVGLLPGATQLRFEEGGQLINAGLDQWDLGLTVEHRIHNQVWAGLSLGVSGFGQITLDESLASEFEHEIEATVFGRFSVNFRPDAP